MRSEENVEENWPHFKPENLGLLSGRSKWLAFSPAPTSFIANTLSV